MAQHQPDQSRDAAIDAPFGVDFVHRLRFTADVLEPANPTLADVLVSDGPARMIAFIDAGVAEAWPDLAGQLAAYLAAHDGLDLVETPRIVTGGESAKNGWSVYGEVVEAIDRAGICRHSYVIAIGGGAMLDAVGFAAATAHRGVRLVRLPTTTLAQGDGGIGVKNGINAFGKKNFLGSFSAPWAVINDESFLTTLHDRDWRSGLSEAVKVALLKDPDEFHRIAALASRLASRDADAVRAVVRRSAELHLEHIVAGGDPFEMTEARPLDFGHWSAHKLEQMTAYDLRHGEAVAIGLAIDVLYAAERGIVGQADAGAVLNCLAVLGFDLFHPALHDVERLLEGLDEFREHLGGRLTITLIEGIGRAVDVHEMDDVALRAALEHLRLAHGTAGQRAERDAG